MGVRVQGLGVVVLGLRVQDKGGGVQGSAGVGVWGLELGDEPFQPKT